jgi:hypothetical protein
MTGSYVKFLYPIIDFVLNKAKEILVLNNEKSEHHLTQIMPINNKIAKL